MVLLACGITLLLAGFLGIARAMQPLRARLSVFELDRLTHQEASSAQEQRQYERYRDEIAGTVWLLQALLIIVVLLTSVCWYGTGIAIFVTVLIALASGVVARWSLIRQLATHLMRQATKNVIWLLQRYPMVRLLLRGPHIASRGRPHVHSREELIDLLTRDTTVLAGQERNLLLNSLRFDDRQVSQLMIPRDKIVSVKKKELLGPLVVSELHQTGHDRFPVIDGDLDHIVGVLRLRQLVTVRGDTKTRTAETAMDTSVIYVQATAHLRMALGAFLAHHHHLLIVVDAEGVTVGLLTIEDVIEALFGEKLEGVL